MKLAIYIQFIFVICSSYSLFGQQDSLQLSPRVTAEKSNLKDTIPVVLPVVQNSGPINVPISKDSFDDEIDYGADDIERVDIQQQEVHLKGNAFVKYKDSEITAGYIILKIKDKEVFAQQLPDASSDAGIPSFVQDGQSVEYKKLKYNFETEQGIVYDAVSRQDQFYVHGGVTKFVKQNPDSLIFDDAIYNKNALITTCDHEHPHYGIRTRKLKIIPDKLAIIGPANLEIAGIPTPIFIPFAFAPLFSTPSGRSGIVFGGTQGFEFSPTLGIGFRDIGYHFALNENMNLTVTGDIYSRGTWGLRVASQYAKRYKYKGNFQIGISRQLIDQAGNLQPDVQKSFSFRLTHNQDQKAHPYIKIGGNLNFTTNDFDRRNYNDAESRLENVINSNFNFSHNLPALENFTLTVGVTHSQNTRTRDISFGLPDVNFRSTTIYPFKGKSSGKDKWYEKINVRYNSRFRNFVSTKDTLLFTQKTLDDLQTGISHEASAGASFTLGKYINFTPSANIKEFWFVKTLEEQYDPDSLFINTNTQDTVVGGLVDILNYGFDRFTSINTSFNLSTNLFNTVSFKKGFLRGIRHTMKPMIGISYAPNTLRFQEVVQDNITGEDYIDPLTGEVETYNPFAGGVFSVPSPRERQMAVTYSLNNIFEGKRWSKKDSTEKKFKIFDNLRFSGNYNFGVDSLRWSPVNASGTARFFSGITTLTLRATFDPYIEQNGRRVNITQLSQEGRLLRFDKFQATISTRFTVSKIRELFAGESESDERNGSNRGSPAGKKKEFMGESIWDLLDRFSVSHTFGFKIDSDEDGKEYEVSANSIRMQGSFPLTDKWEISVGNFSYDFKAKRFVYPTFGLSRDLHCWQMMFNWQPARGTYTFNIGVKTSELSNFLKYDYSKNNIDSRFR